MKFAEAINRFLIARRALARSPHTLKSYRFSLELLLHHAGDLEVEDVTPLHIDALFADLQNRYAPSSLRTFCLAHKTFWNWAVSRRLVESSPVALDTPSLPRLSDMRNRAFSDEEVRALIAAAAEKGPMQEALVRFLADTAARIGAACGLRIGDIDMSTCSACVVEKGRRPVRVTFTPATRKALSAWIRARPTCMHDYVFVAPRRRTPMHPQRARNILRQIGEAAGVEGVRPHRFRHTVGRRWALAGVPVTVTARKLNHENPQTTARYYENMDDEDVRRFTEELGLD